MWPQSGYTSCSQDGAIALSIDTGRRIEGPLVVGPLDAMIKVADKRNAVGRGEVPLTLAFDKVSVTLVKVGRAHTGDS